jgi:hypothetical protein
VEPAALAAVGKMCFKRRRRAKNKESTKDRFFITGTYRHENFRSPIFIAAQHLSAVANATNLEPKSIGEWFHE